VKVEHRWSWHLLKMEFCLIERLDVTPGSHNLSLDAVHPVSYDSTSPDPALSGFELPPSHNSYTRQLHFLLQMALAQEGHL